MGADGGAGGDGGGAGGDGGGGGEGGDGLVKGVQYGALPVPAMQACEHV